MIKLPLHDAITAYAETDPARFHMPGHKGKLSPFDVTEIDGTDNLHSPSGAILESETLCARALGARDAFFLVNGSTAGNIAMLLLLGSGRRVLLGRNCHKSVINGLALAGLDCAPLLPNTEGVFEAEAIEKELGENGCDAVFITSPNYMGAVSNIDRIAQAAHKHGALLFVDCAHGAHYAFSGELPPVPSEADAWCVSTHKTLNALTQTAVLLLGASCPFNRSDVQRALNMVQSTSPSYELMQSIESSVLRPGDWDPHIRRIMSLRERLANINSVRLLGDKDHRRQDVTRLNISVERLSGYELSEKLSESGIIPEMADSECVVLITTPEDKDEWYESLFHALSALEHSKEAETKIALPDLETLRGEQRMTVRDAVLGPVKAVSPEKSVGCICAQAVGCYPPGVAVLFPGETITQKSIDYLLMQKRNGAELFGMSDGMITVVDEVK